VGKRKVFPLIRSNDAEIRLSSYRQQERPSKIDGSKENTVMLTKLTLVLALMIAALATMAPAGPGDGGQGSFSYGDNATGIASGGGNLVPLW
jgi:hypothetical protein